MIRLPPRSTLFPTPPLSRSEEQGEGDGDQCRVVPAGPEDGQKQHGARQGGGDAAGQQQENVREAGGAGQDRGGVSADAEEADRKSTRLNSSHSQISYAVFCL